ncbi:hypothetical protein [Parasulfitobacter algicola]|uniref:Uncharacterized protein n=1 Tax=Parasulfitobacter algicola TaxID=2614809 RepID=A0ABX2IQX0_9RHOB|nr:hypothetical protein [Sulfitobacter algicola]NSX55289.1 hypothetical protein [Sulfitobacter algicola]
MLEYIMTFTLHHKATLTVKYAFYAALAVLFSSTIAAASPQSYSCAITTICASDQSCQPATDLEFWVTVIDDNTLETGDFADDSNRERYARLDGSWETGGTFALGLKGSAIIFTSKADKSFVYTGYQYGLASQVSDDLQTVYSGHGTCSAKS